MTSCGASGQESKISKVTKDTLMFSFDREYLEQDKIFDSEYKIRDGNNRSEGISLEIKEVHYGLRVKEIYDLKQFTDRVEQFKTGGRIKSRHGKLFDRLNRNVVIFVDNSEKQLKFMEMEVSLYTID